MYLSPSVASFMSEFIVTVTLQLIPAGLNSWCGPRSFHCYRFTGLVTPGLPNLLRVAVRRLSLSQRAAAGNKSGAAFLKLYLGVLVCEVN